MIGPISSKRQADRVAKAVGRIADAVIHELPPNAPYQRIRRHVRARCDRAALPEPSRSSLTARIANVRRYGTSMERPYAHQLTIDHCVLALDATAEPKIATLSIAVLEPPGLLVAWGLAGGIDRGEATAALVAAAQRRAAGDVPARISARLGLGRTDAALLAALEVGRVGHVGRRSSRPCHGTEARRLIGRSLGRLRFLPSLRSADARWATDAHLLAVWPDIERDLQAHFGPSGHKACRFELAHGSFKVGLLDGLDAIEASSPNGRHIRTPGSP